MIITIVKNSYYSVNNHSFFIIFDLNTSFELIVIYGYLAKRNDL